MLFESRKRASFSQMIWSATTRLLRPLTLVEILLHVNVGERYLGFSAVLAPALMLGIALNSSTGGGLLFLAVAFIIRILLHSTSSRRRFEYGGELVHSRYPGHPLFGWLNGKMKEPTARGLEACLVAAIGGVICLLDQTLGAYLLCSGAAMLLALGLRESIAHDQLLDKIDAEIERRAEETEFQNHINRIQPCGITLIQDEPAKAPPLLEAASANAEEQTLGALAVN